MVELFITSAFKTSLMSRFYNFATEYRPIFVKNKVMKITYHNIPGTQAPMGYVHATIAEAAKIVFISGQPGTDKKGNLPSGLADQITNALINVALACEAAGTTSSSIVKVTFYVVNWHISMMEELIKGTSAAKASYDLPDVALTLLNVHGLFTPDMLVEIEAVAVL